MYRSIKNIFSMSHDNGQSNSVEGEGESEEHPAQVNQNPDNTTGLHEQQNCLLDGDETFHTGRCDDEDEAMIIKELSLSNYQENQTKNQSVTKVDDEERGSLDSQQKTAMVQSYNIQDQLQSETDDPFMVANTSLISNIQVDLIETTNSNENIQESNVSDNEGGKPNVGGDIDCATRSDGMEHPTLDHNTATSSTLPPPPNSLFNQTTLPLHSKWTLWYDHPKLAPPGSDWKDNLESIGTFQTVEGFWRVFNNMKPPQDCSATSNISVFRYGIVPSWEDAHNIQGGKFVLTIVKKDVKLIWGSNKTNECWLQTVLAVIGETMDQSGNQINGAVVSLRKHENRIALWCKSTDVSICANIGVRWKKILLANLHLNTGPNEDEHQRQQQKNKATNLIKLKFVTHQASASTGRSFRNESHFEL